jgi:uncharacterized protein YecE (DUF72 family)
VGKIQVGTASWTDPTLIKSGRFYPKGVTSAAARLRFYATRFELVEVNSSYYALPSPANSLLWAERTPDSFTFNIKAFRLFTGHQTPLDALPPGLREALPDGDRKRNVYYKDVPAEIRDQLWTLFIDAISPLEDAGKLGAIHFQFPPWVFYSRAGFEHLEECRSRLPLNILSIEFRSPTWFAEGHRDKTLGFEREHGLVNVVVDEPQGFPNSVPQIWESTNPHLAVVRLHGRNAATWDVKGKTTASDRFNYDYPNDELSELATSIKQLARGVDRVQVVFNNNYGDQGQRNATTLIELLK